MTAPMLIAQLSVGSAEGHGEYRVHGPGRDLARQPGVTAVECDPDHRWAPWLAEHADVLVLHHIAPDYAPLAGRRRAAGRATVLEASDHYLDPQPWSAYSAGWRDRGRQGVFWHLMAAVDAVQTSTEHLAELWKPAARRVFVFPNRLPYVPVLPPVTNRPFTVGWAGTGTHLPDWYAVAPAMEAWVRAQPSARLAVMTDELARPFVRLPADRYAFRPPGSLAAYSAFLRELDVAVVPLLPAPFNRGRTDLKFAELAAHGVVGVFAAEGPYPTAIDHGRTGFLYCTPAELTAALDRLTDPQVRSAVRSAAHATVVSRQANDPTPYRLANYRELIPSPVNAELPAELRAEAIADGAYLRLPLGGPEQAVKASRTGGQAEALTQIIRRHPWYIPARRAAANTALRASRPRDAVGLLEPVLGGPADGPELLAEAAVAYLAAGDAAIARSLAEKAVARNPAFADGWRLLLRLADADGPEAALRWADRAAANQPHDYLAALLPLRYLSPEERAIRLIGWLDRFASNPHPEDRPYLAAAVGRVVAELLGPDPAHLPVLARAAAAFPESARLASAHAAALYAAGQPALAAAEHARAATLARAADAFRMEYPDPPAERRLWAVGEYAHAHPPEGFAGA